MSKVAPAYPIEYEPIAKQWERFFEPRTFPNEKVPRNRKPMYDEYI